MNGREEHLRETAKAKALREEGVCAAQSTQSEVKSSSFSGQRGVVDPRSQGVQPIRGFYNFAGNNGKSWKRLNSL